MQGGNQGKQASAGLRGQTNNKQTQQFQATQKSSPSPKRYQKQKEDQVPVYTVKIAKAPNNLNDPQDLLDIFEIFGENYQLFATAMFECFMSCSTDHQGFVSLRNQVVLDMLTYNKTILPVVKSTLDQIRKLSDLIRYATKTPEELIQTTDVFDVLNQIVKLFNYVQELHGPVIDIAFIRSQEAKKTINELSQVSEQLFQTIKQQQEEINVETQAQKQRNQISIPLLGSIFKTAQRLFGGAEAQINILQLKSDLITNKENNLSIIRAVTIIEQALVPTLQNYFDVIEQLSIIFKTLFKRISIIYNPSIAVEYKTIRAQEIINYLLPIAQQIGNYTHMISGLFSNSNSKFQALEENIYKGNNVKIWNELFLRNQNSLIKELTSKEEEFYHAYNLGSSGVPKMRDFLPQTRIHQNSEYGLEDDDTITQKQEEIKQKQEQKQQDNKNIALDDDYGMEDEQQHPKQQLQQEEVQVQNQTAQQDQFANKPKRLFGYF